MNKVKLIFHISDIHIRTYVLHKEFQEVFDDLYLKLKELMVGYEYSEVRIALVGDLVHSKTIISNEQLTICTQFLKKLSDIAPLIIVAGNHDLNLNNKDRMDSITPMVKLLNNPNISYFKDSECYLDDNIIWANYSIFQDNERPDIEAFKINNKGEYTTIGLFHGPILGAKTDIGYEFEHATSLEHFEGCDIVMLGDIHKRQNFYYKQTKEIDENELKQYIKDGWLIDN
jgi:predicted MPP superfamily phosphohydrolase